MMEDKLQLYGKKARRNRKRVEAESDWRILDKGRKYFASVGYLADQAKK